MAIEPSDVSELAAAPVHELYPVTTPRPRARFASSATKRAFDIVGAAIALVVSSPVFLLIALAIKLDGRGPVIFKQVRIGARCKPFVIWKFRTMRPDADRIAPNISPSSDPRVTRVGKFLRRSYLDELPQLLNVLVGTMSIVGPRPETPEFVALYSAEERRVLNVKPGLLGPSTLASMDESALLEAADDPYAYYVAVLMHERVRLDLGYLDQMSLGTDLRLLARQLWKIVMGRG